jgi:hypothetical protein
MTQDDLDRILSSDDVLKPSSGFSGNVMAAVRAAAVETNSPFPWLRFTAGIAGCGGAAAAFSVLVLHFDAAIAHAFGPMQEVAPELGYAALCLIATLAFAAIPRALSRL